MVMEPGHGQTVLVGEVRESGTRRTCMGCLTASGNFGIDLVSVEQIGPAGETMPMKVR
jgi:hypothetical protein